MNTVTDIQRELINKIESKSRTQFKGRTKEDAVLFIKTYIKKTDKLQGTVATLKQKEYCRNICKLLDISYDPESRTSATKFIEDNWFNALIEADRIILSSGNDELIDKRNKLNRRSAIVYLAASYIRANDAVINFH